MPMRDIVLQQVVEEASRQLPPAESKVFDVLMTNLGIPLAGDEIARKIWPERDWERSRNSLQISIYQLRQRFGPNVVESRGLVDGRGAAYSLNLEQLEAAILQRKIRATRPAETGTTSPHPLFATLSRALNTSKIDRLMIWGATSLSLLLESVERVLPFALELEACPMRICVPASAWSKSVQFLSRLVTSVPPTVSDFEERCFGRFEIFLTYPLLGNGVITYSGTGKTVTAELFSDDQVLELDTATANLLVQDLQERWTYTEASIGTSLLSCDAKDGDANRFRSRLLPHYRRLMGDRDLQNHRLRRGPQ